MKRKRNEGLLRMATLDIERIKNIDPELATHIYMIYREMMKLRNDLEEAKKSERQAWAENVAYQTEIEALKREIDILHTNMSQLRERYEEKVREANQLKIEHEDLSLKNTSRAYLTQLEGKCRII